MAAMHWEARRKQVVVDKKFDFQQRLKEQHALRGNDDSYYNEANIRQIAEEMSRDVATPLPSMLRRSHAQLVKRHSATPRQFNTTANFEDRLFQQGVKKDRTYSAKLANRYNSVSYTQQY